MATRRRICRIRVLAENSPVWRMRVLAKMLFFGKWVGLDTFARHSPTTFPGLDTFARHSPTLSPDSIHSPDICQPFSPDSIHSLTVTFADIRQNVTRIRHIRTSNSPFWQIWREWPLLTNYTQFVILFLFYSIYLCLYLHLFVTQFKAIQNYKLY